MRTQKIEEWIEALPEEVEGVKIRVGTRRSLPYVAVLILPNFEQAAADRFKDLSPLKVESRDELADLIWEEAEASGWGHGTPVLRCHAIDKGGKIKRSLQITRDAQEEKRAATDSSATLYEAFNTLAKSVEKSNATLVKTIDILTESLAHREDVMAGAIDGMMQAQQERVASEAESLIAMVENSIPSNPEADPIREQAAGILGQIAAGLSGGPSMTMEGVASMMKENPEMVREMMQDPTIQEAFKGAMGGGD